VLVVHQDMLQQGFPLQGAGTSHCEACSSDHI
jgi:hypothetical protein